MKNILLVSIIIFVITVLATCLAVTVKYGYVEEIKHFHTDICYVNDCVIMNNGCNNPCYWVVVNYNLYLLNNTEIYTKVSGMTVYDSNFCNQKSLNCYYDDRNISQSLALYQLNSQYQLVFLSVFLG